MVSFVIFGLAPFSQNLVFELWVQVVTVQSREALVYRLTMNVYLRIGNFTALGH